MTVLNVNLSSNLKTQLSQGGVYLQVVVFGNNSPAPLNTTPIIYSGDGSGGYPVLPASLSVDLSQWGTLTGGKVYFIVQSVAPGTTPISITDQSQINWDSAQTNSYRYDSFEVTLQNSPNDAGNLTSVNGFGLPMNLGVQTHTASGTAFTDSRGYAISGSELFTKLSSIGDAQTVFAFTQGPLAATSPAGNRAAISPAEAVGSTPQNPAFAAGDWSTYVTSLQGAAASKIELTGFFNGAKDANGVYHNGGFFSYQLEWDAAKGVFWLNPTESSQIKGYIKIDPSQLENSIYSTLGNVQIYQNKTDANPYTIYKNTNTSGNNADMNTGDNNQWGKVLSQFLIGFTAGYYGVSGQSDNSAATPIDLNKNWNWDPSYAFGSNLSGSATPTFMDPYAKVFFYNSNSYGSGYSDALMSQYSSGGPLVSVYDPSTSTNVSAIDITLYADGDTTAGYIKPTMNNYLAPTSGTQYAVPVYSSAWAANQSSVTLNFSNSGVVLNDKAAISLQILTGYDASTGAAQFATVQIGGNGVSPWQEWNINYDTTTGTYSASAVPGTTSAVPGSLVINQFPTVQDGVGWYRVVVGSGDAAKTFNLYVEANNYEFVNPTASDPSLAIDGLASIAPGALNGDGTLHTFSVNFAPGSTLTVDPSLVHAYTDYNYTSAAPANAPVAGTYVNGIFQAVAGQSSQVSNNITVQQGQLAFGWTGTNSDANTGSWISGLTNKIMGQSAAVITITPASGGNSYAPLTTHADVDGQWQTGVSQQLGNGTYQITMTEYAAKDTAYAHAMTPASSTLTVTVNMSSLPVAPTGSGSGIQVAPDTSGTAGNWVSLNTVSSALSSDATLLIYATNAAGQMVDRNGGVTTDLNQAVLGHVGSVHSDAGATFFNGSQMIYLGVGQELHFALKTGNDVVNVDPSVSVAQGSGGALNINVAGLQLTAVTDNTLSDFSQMAAAQRMYDRPIIHLKQGQQVDVNTVGSADNTNTLHFVKVDMNPTTHEMSIAGVAFENSAAFRDVVKAHLDGGYSSTNGGGTFDTTSSWTVTGGTGFYAPVLVGQSGEVFVVGTANSDGASHIRTFGENIFGFEDLTAAQGADFDYNDMVVKITPHDFLV